MTSLYLPQHIIEYISRFITSIHDITQLVQVSKSWSRKGGLILKCIKENGWLAVFMEFITKDDQWQNLHWTKPFGFGFESQKSFKVPAEVYLDPFGKFYHISDSVLYRNNVKTNRRHYFTMDVTTGDLIVGCPCSNATILVRIDSLGNQSRHWKVHWYVQSIAAHAGVIVTLKPFSNKLSFLRADNRVKDVQLEAPNIIHSIWMNKTGLEVHMWEKHVVWNISESNNDQEQTFYNMSFTGTDDKITLWDTQLNVVAWVTTDQFLYFVHVLDSQFKLAVRIGEGIHEIPFSLSCSSWTAETHYITQMALRENDGKLVLMALHVNKDCVDVLEFNLKQF